MLRRAGAARRRLRADAPRRHPRLQPGKSSKPARAIVSHLDTLGAQVKLLKDNGRLELVPIGTLVGALRRRRAGDVFTERGAYRGTILPLKASGHTFNDEIDTLPIGWPYVELRVDAMARTAADVGQLGIDVGDIVAIDPAARVPRQRLHRLAPSRQQGRRGDHARRHRGAARSPARELTVDIYWLFTIAEEVGVGAAAILTPDVASMVTVDNGTTRAGPELGRVRRHHLHGRPDRAVRLSPDPQAGASSAARTTSATRRTSSATTAPIRPRRSRPGHDVRTALITFGVDASHGYERIHLHALRSLAELVTAYVTSPVEIKRDARELSASLKGFPRQPMDEAPEQGSEKPIDEAVSETSRAREAT